MALTCLYFVYVGHYDSPKIPKADVEKIKKLGLNGYVFSRGTHYALKVFSTPDVSQANIVKLKLESLGFVTELETFNIKNSLHI